MLSKLSLIAFLAAGLLDSVIAVPPAIVFDCNVTPGACTNMCWGAFCAGYGEGLHYDQAIDSVKTARRTKAGCGSGNRCCDDSPDPDGSSCDEYPFASTVNADNVQQVNRCIPPLENSSMYRLEEIILELRQLTKAYSTGQGGSLSSFYQHQLGNNPGDFTVTFSNPDNDATQYCEYGTQCKNDGNQFLGDDLAPDGHASKLRHKRHYYTLRSNTTILSPRELDVSTPIYRAVKRSIVEMGLIKRGGGNPFELVTDSIMDVAEGS